MSVINQMLNDLEKRQPPSAAAGAVGHSPVIKPKQSKLVWVLLLALIGCGGGFAYLVMNPSVLSPATAAPVPTSALTVTPTPPPSVVAVNAPPPVEANEPLSASATVPDEIALPLDEPKLTAVEPANHVATEQQAQARDDALVTLTETVVEPEPIEQAVAAPASVSEPTVVIQAPKPVVEAKKVSPPVAEPPAPPRAQVAFNQPKQTAAERVGLLLNDARTAWHRKQQERALSHYRELLLLAPKHIAARKEYAQILAALSRRQDAEALLLDGIKKQHAPVQWVMMLASIRAEQGDYQGGLYALAMVTTPPSERDYFHLQAALATKLGQFDIAKQAYQWLSAHQPDNGRWWLGLAVSCEQLEQTTQALAAYERAQRNQNLSRKSRTYIEQKIAVLRSSNGA